jgi:surfactin synthase thioesterase subunit
MLQASNILYNALERARIRLLERQLRFVGHCMGGM